MKFIWFLFSIYYIYNKTMKKSTHKVKRERSAYANRLVYVCTENVREGAKKFSNLILIMYYSALANFFLCSFLSTTTTTCYCWLWAMCVRCMQNTSTVSPIFERQTLVLSDKRWTMHRTIHIFSLIFKWLWLWLVIKCVNNFQLLT